MLHGRNNPFAGAGLVLADYRLISEDYKKEFADKDKAYRDEQAKFLELEISSGVYEILKKYDKHFLYLSIDRLDEHGKPLWWLNPMQQNIYNSGWYHTQDLLDWEKDKGPIIKKKK